jgi:hypothetical protein
MPGMGDEERGSAMKTPCGFCGLLSQRSFWITGGIDLPQPGVMISCEYV